MAHAAPESEFFTGAVNDRLEGYKYPPRVHFEILEKDLALGKVDAVIVWGPIAGYFAKRVSEPHLIVVPLSSEPRVRLEYEIAMDVRFGEPT